MKRILIGIIGVSTCLVGCQSYPVKLDESDCGVWVFAIPFASHADPAFYDQTLLDKYKYMHHTCLSSAYVKMNQTKLVQSKVVSGPSRQDEIDPQLQIMGSKEGVQFRARSGWQVVESPTSIYQFFARHKRLDATLAISVYEQNPLITWSDTRDALYRRVTEALGNVEKGRFNETHIAGAHLFSIEYSGEDELSRLPLKFLGTHYRIGRKNVYLTLWCLKQNYSSLREEFEAIRDSLTLVDVSEFN